VSTSIADFVVSNGRRLVLIKGDRKNIACDKRFVGHENAIQNAPCNRPLISFPCSVKPTLKKVSNENKFAKLQKKAEEFNLRKQLKQYK
jgi:hypothetical protein